MGRLRISYNAPVVLTFALLAVIVEIAWPGAPTGPGVKAEWFTTQGQLGGLNGYVSLFTHVIGHAGWNHLIANFMLILLLGPILEERYGSMSLLVMIAITAVVSGLVDVALGDRTLGASGIVFMMIVLASTANIRAGSIPLTFIAIALIYIGREVASSFDDDNVSQLGHILGGVCGAAFGFIHARGKHIGPAKPVKTILPGAPVVVRKKP
ncbi:MAG: rhomboid family intramembrane serine protease [Kofleriaceae bacterium]